jgi:hypothetical protein
MCTWCIAGAARIKIKQLEDRIYKEARQRGELDNHCAALEHQCREMVMRMESMQVLYMDDQSGMPWVLCHGGEQVSLAQYSWKYFGPWCLD